MENLKYLLDDEHVKKEIERHKWLESERQGRDIGIELAESSWLELYGADWIKSKSQSGAAALPAEESAPAIPNLLNAPRISQKKKAKKSKNNKTAARYTSVAA